MLIVNFRRKHVNTTILHFRTLACVIAALASAGTLSAIKIDIPKQYQQDVERLRAEEAARLEQDLKEVREDSPPADAGTGAAPAETERAGLTIEPEEEEAATESGSFLLESVDEAERTAESFAQDLGENEGLISGQVLNEESGAPVSGVAILLEGTDIGTITDGEGRYTLGPAPAGSYTLSFVKTGYIEANVTDFAVKRQEVSVFPFALPPRPVDMSDEVYELQDFSVTAEEANELMIALDLRMTSDSIMNVMTAEDFSRFAASDVGAAIKRVAGVTVEGGKFAVIRGLDERYSSTTFNGVPVPSPDPDRQSVPLDLFPSEIVGNLVVSKTFTPEMPGNSAGGSIDIRTSTFPEEWEFSFTAKGGFNDLAQDRFIERSGPEARSIDFDNQDSALDTALDPLSSGFLAAESDADIESEFELKAGGTSEWLGRTFRFLATASVEEDFTTKEGFEENRFARGGRDLYRPIGSTGDIRFSGTGDLTNGELPGTSGRFDLTESEHTERTTLLLSTKFDIDTDGEHQLGLTYFSNEETSDIASLRANGRLEGFDPSAGQLEFQELTPYTADLLDELSPLIGNDPNTRVAEFLRLRSFISNTLRQEREIEVFQLSGEHRPLNFLEGLELNWNLSRSEAEQQESDVATTQALQDTSDGRFFTGQAQGVTFLQPSYAWRNIFEEQDYAKVDGKYRFDLGPDIEAVFGAGYSRDRSERETEQLFQVLKLDTFGNALGRPPAFSLEEAIRTEFRGVSGQEGIEPFAFAPGEREIDARHLSGKLTLFENWDLFAGVRFEKVSLTSSTNADTGEDFFNFEVLRDSSSGPTPIPAQINTQILGINNGQPLPTDFKGEIDENKALPSLGLTFRPIEGSRLSLAYSETMVRPSFKEFTFITVQNPVSLDFETGNPALEVSDVRSLDFRAEYTWDRGDMVAVALFTKEVDNPIEKTALSGTVQTDIFFNNPNTAEIRGVEFEFRKNLGFLGNDFMEYFSVGGNFTLIDASVDIPETFQLLLSGGLPDPAGTGTIGGGAYAEFTGDRTDPARRFEGRFNDPPSERVLFQQPEWIVNADIGFDHPEWGTRATLSFFAQSEVLSRAGGFGDQRVTVDEFQKSFHEVNLTFSQRLNDYFSAGFSVKNLTNSERGIVYDDIVGGTKRSFRVGRDYSFFITATF